MKERRDEERDYSVPDGNNPIHKASPDIRLQKGGLPASLNNKYLN